MLNRRNDDRVWTLEYIFLRDPEGSSRKPNVALALSLTALPNTIQSGFQALPSCTMILRPASSVSRLSVCWMRCHHCPDARLHNCEAPTCVLHFLTHHQFPPQHWPLPSRPQKEGGLSSPPSFQTFGVSLTRLLSHHRHRGKDRCPAGCRPLPLCQLQA